MQVKLKDEGERITFLGRAQEITKDNLTLERYEWVKKNHPALLDRFEIIEEVKAEPKAKKSE